MSILKEVQKRVEAHKKANPLTIKEILQINTIDYNTDLTKRILKEVQAEQK